MSDMVKMAGKQITRAEWNALSRDEQTAIVREDRDYRRAEFERQDAAALAYAKSRPLSEEAKAANAKYSFVMPLDS